uniref:Uncharacterized protein n=1 Tax=Pithovirus LCPAC403 TaxID=2506596 RepID=A0A481ZDV6_9VIRU|nr:MAG: uncharacterized protein LCPAC403_03530 [Pithovirus LCPAC403]
MSKIETDLVDKGYKIVDKINTVNLCEYIKCLNKSGHFVFVKLDKGGIVTKSNHNYTYVISENDLVPFEIIMGFYNTAGTIVAGIGIETQEGVSFLITDNSSYPKMTNFVTILDSKRLSFKLACPNENLAVYPVVRLSEIVKHPTLMTKAINVSSERIMRMQFSLAKSRLKTLSVVMEKLSLNLNLFIDLKNTKINELYKSIEELERIAKGNSKSKKINEEKDFQVTKNLEIRHILFTKLLHICNRVHTISKLDTLNDHIVDVTEHIKSNYNDLDSVKF